MTEVKIDFGKGKDVAFSTRKKELVEFCFNWCKRLKHCGMLYDHVVSGQEVCTMCQIKKFVPKPIKIDGVSEGKFIFISATTEEAKQMLFVMPAKVSKP